MVAQGTKMDETRDHFAVNDMFEFAVSVLEAATYPQEHARATAYALLEADKRGIFSHGIAGGTGLEEAVTISGITATVIPGAKPELLPQKYSTIAVIDAHGAPGHISAQIAVELVKRLSREHGMAKVYVKNANHYGAACVWTHRIAEDGDLVGSSTCTTAACAVPMGDDPACLDYTKGAGRETRMGTNPIAVSVPHEDGILTIDMALTRMAVSYCIKALKAGEMLTIPEYLANADYNSSLDPEDLLDPIEGGCELKGSIFPLGSTLAGYKGDILLRMIEVDHSLGGGPIVKIPWVAKADSRRISLAFQAQVVDFLLTKEQATARVRSLMRDYEENYFGPSSRWPGDRSNAAISYALEHGIPYSRGQVETLERAASHVGLDFDRMIKSVGTKPYPKEIFKK
jgi:LDH2 family malate/lactate/ureidoglycolate dehydrogenase